MSENKDQTHPQERRDRETVNRLLNGERNPHSMAELARLRIRYLGFPGAREIQRDLDNVLYHWGMQEEELFTITRELHAKGQVYTNRGKDEKEDWS